jgi:carbonic anhydrase/acetyltransferase-like protein (isoleucine patch superfamily)
MGDLMPILPFKNIMPKIAEPYFLAENSYVIGDVQIGKFCSILYGAVIRGDVNYIIIGEYTNIQDLSILHVTHKTFPLIIGSNVSIGHGAKVHGCVIGNNVLVGIGAIILDGAKIPDNSIVAAGSVVREGYEAPPNTLIAGVPAKPKRELNENDMERIEYSALSYVRELTDRIK